VSAKHQVTVVLLLGFSALEAHVNAMCSEFAISKHLSLHERALLLEQDVRLDDGEFKSFGLKMYRLEDRIGFLHKRFSGKPLNRKSPWWGALGTATDIRNKLTHPKGVQKLTVDAVKSAIRAIIDTIDAIYLAIYKKRFPAAKRGLQSKLTF
jgi:hypothetical protein